MQKGQVWTTRRLRNAPVLVHIRETTIDEVLAQLTERDISLHLLGLVKILILTIPYSDPDPALSASHHLRASICSHSASASSSVLIESDQISVWFWFSHFLCMDVFLAVITMLLLSKSDP